MNLAFERHYPHPVQKVWRALTSSAALAKWLMQNDFEPEIGRSCTFRFCTEDGEDESLVYVTVEALRPPVFMRWRWRNQGERGPTTVTFELEPTDTGTLLRIRHTGEASPGLSEGLKQGWPTKLDELEQALSL